MATWSAYNVAISDASDDTALVFNTRTGALVRLDRSRVAELGSQEPIAEDFGAFLLRHGFLVEDGTDELDLIRRSHATARADTSSFTATIELTQSCNFRCRYCYQGHQPGRVDGPLGDEIVTYLLERMQGRRRLHVNWFGGEPLLAMGRLRSMSRALTAAAAREEWSFTQFITTNGYLLTRARARELVDLGVSGAQITVDGAAPEHDSSRPFLDGRPTYERVLAGCVNAVTAGMSLVLRINLSQANLGAATALVRQLPERGLTPQNTVVHVTRMVDHGHDTCDQETSQSALTVAQFAQAWVGILRGLADQGFSLPPLDPIAYNCPFDLDSTEMIGADGSLLRCTSSDDPLGTIGASSRSPNGSPDGSPNGSPDNRSAELTAARERAKARDPFADPTCRTCLHLPMCMGGCGYLADLGEEKCPPEHYVLPHLVALTAQRTERR